MNPEYSVVIPTFNRAKILARCLRHLAELEYPNGGWEVLVVDNGSTDNTQDVVEAYAEALPRLRYFYTINPGLHIGRNLASKKAHGDILCFIDDDSFVSHRWLRGIESAFRDTAVVLVGGPCLPQHECKPPQWLTKLWCDVEYGRCFGYLSLLDFGEHTKYVPARYVYGCNFSIRKDLLDRVGGFHPDAMPESLVRYRGDGETAVVEKLADMGHEALYDPNVRIRHLVTADRTTKQYFCHRAYIQGISASFRQIRDYYSNKANARPSADGARQVNGVLERTLNWIEHRIVRHRRRLFACESDRVRRACQECYQRGFVFHQREVKEDPRLLEWVLRENYLGENGRLPEQGHSHRRS